MLRTVNIRNVTIASGLIWTLVLVAFLWANRGEIMILGREARA